ncbi:MAG: endo-1,4-beta-xylanase [Deltaproteobacteria bacterium]|nr:endo-1,4-beta-xylanase [Deltaproteobacteria bacterium]
METNKISICCLMILTICFVFSIIAIPLPAYGMNILENSSIEIASSCGWSLGSSHRITSPLDQLDATNAYHGQVSLKLEFSQEKNGQKVVSKIYRLEPGKQYTVSLYAKSDFSAADFTIQLVNTFQPPYGPGDVIGPYTLRASSNWQRFSFTGTTISEASKCSYQLIMYPAHQGVPNQYIWIDAIQLEEGPITEYRPRASVEVSLVSDGAHKGNVFFEDEPIIMKLKLHNTDKVAKNITTYYEVYDYYNRKVKEGSINSNIQSESSYESNLDLSLAQNKRGAFRAIFWVAGLDGTIKEVNYSVLPRPRNVNVDDSIMGAHVPFSDYFLSLMQKVGVKWNRTLSTGKQFRWNVIEPTKGDFIWKDAEISRAANYGMKVLGTIGSEIVSVPTWAQDTDGLPKLDEWDRFVFTVVNHYKDQVKHWEIWNEPDTEGGLEQNSAFYAELLKTAYNAAKRADPDCVVVGMVAYYNSYIEDVFDRIGNGYCDLASTHLYPPMNLSHLPEKIDIYSTNGKALWNSETGMKTDSFYQNVLWEDLWISYAQPDDWDRSYIRRTDWLVWNFAHSVGSVCEKYFYYDARQTTALDFLIAYSLFEYDGTLRPKAVAYSVLANLFDGSSGQGEIGIDIDTYAYLFVREEVPLIIIWAKGTSDTNLLNIGLSPEQVKVYDIMGNEKPISSGVAFGRSPIYIEGQGITKDQLISSLSISVTSDVNAPNLSIVTSPTGPADGDRILFRWFAVDDVSPSTRWETTPESILYAYKLEGSDSDWSSWITTTSKTYFNIPNGNYTFSVKAKDVVSNISPVVSRKIVILTDPDTPDTSEPAVTITKPTSRGTYSTSQSTIVVAGSASDNLGVTRVTWENDRGGDGIASGTDTWTISTISLQEGDNVITVTAYDAAGNSVGATLTVTYTAPHSGMLYEWIQAESGNITSPLETVSDPDASAGAYIWKRPGSGDSAATPDGTAEYTIDIPTTGDYVIWGRAIAPDGGSNSFFTSIDGGEHVAWHVQTGSVWTLDSVNGHGPLVFNLAAGTHTLKISGREDGTKLDRLLITNDMAFVPSEEDPYNVPPTGCFL